MTSTIADVCSHPVTTGITPHIDILRAQRLPVTILAIGSSSTAGYGASQSSKGYVEQLQTDLDTVWGNGMAQVINKGVGSDTLAKIYARIDPDVYSQKPQLVILQTGVNDAFQQINQVVFRKQMEWILDDFYERQYDVIVVGGQYLTNPPNNYNDYMEIMSNVSKEHKSPFISRQELSTRLLSIGLEAKDIISSDNLHPNDLMHACTAAAIASVINHKN